MCIRIRADEARDHGCVSGDHARHVCEAREDCHSPAGPSRDPRQGAQWQVRVACLKPCGQVRRCHLETSALVAETWNPRLQPPRSNRDQRATNKRFLQGGVGTGCVHGVRRRHPCKRGRCPRARRRNDAGGGRGCCRSHRPVLARPRHPWIRAWATYRRGTQARCRSATPVATTLVSGAGGCRLPPDVCDDRVAWRRAGDRCARRPRPVASPRAWPPAWPQAWERPRPRSREQRRGRRGTCRSHRQPPAVLPRACDADCPRRAPVRSPSRTHRGTGAVRPRILPGRATHEHARAPRRTWRRLTAAQARPMKLREHYHRIRDRYFRTDRTAAE